MLGQNVLTALAALLVLLVVVIGNDVIGVVGQLCDCLGLGFTTCTLVGLFALCGVGCFLGYRAIVKAVLSDLFDLFALGCAASVTAVNDFTGCEVGCRRVGLFFPSVILNNCVATFANLLVLLCVALDLLALIGVLSDLFNCLGLS